MAVAARTGSASVSCVVWEWQRDDGGYSPYPPEISSQMETAFSSGSGSCVMTDYTVHFSTMRQKNSNSGYERAIRRTTLQLPASPDIKAYWAWNEYGRSFVPYSVDSFADIELAHQKGLSSVNLSTCPCRLPYTIDFTSMDQTRHGYGTKRRIQRHPTSASLQSLLQPKTGTASSSSSSSVTATVSTPSFSVGHSPSLPKSAGRRIKSKATSGSGGKARSRPKKSSGGGATSKSKSSGLETSSASISGDPEVAPYAKKIHMIKPEDDGPCPICMSQLSELSGFEEEERPMPSIPLLPPLDVYQLRKCEHMMHHACLLMYMKNSSNSGFMCPTCKKVYGVKMGNMPDGTMNVTTNRSALPGHAGYGTIQITYNFKPGIHNGQRYRTNGFPRVCYLPDSPKGQKVLKLLKIAWERRLTFTIATSVTTGATDTVVWNEIHHKTESTSNHSGHGYPDPNYLDNVLMELAAQGVEDSSEPETISISSDSDSDL